MKSIFSFFTLKNIFYLLFLIVILAILTFSAWIADQLYLFAVNHLSDDGAIQGGVIGMKRYIHIGLFLVFMVGLFLYILSIKTVKQFVTELFVPQSVLRFFTGVPNENSKLKFLYHFVFVFSTVSGFVLLGMYFFRSSQLIAPLFYEDAFFENLTALSFFIASVLLILTALRKPKQAKLEHSLVYYLTGFCAILFLNGNGRNQLGSTYFRH
jgi:hypothetical protein